MLLGFVALGKNTSGFVARSKISPEVLNEVANSGSAAGSSVVAGGSELPMSGLINSVNPGGATKNGSMKPLAVLASSAPTDAVIAT